MKDWLVIGPNLLSGIGQVTLRYADLFDAEYVQIGHEPKQTRYKNGFAFVLPIQAQMDMIDRYAMLCDRMVYMTVCETEPVNPVYGVLAKYKTIYCPSEFARQIMAKQFPNVSWKLLRHWAPERPHVIPGPAAPYTFYTIGNVLDPRKNIKGLIQAFQECNFGQAARLVIKATCIQPVDWKIPGVVVINGLMADEDLERIHGACHCYVNCSHSEGVGMGAVEAAMRAKPVIITDFGGLKEYVRTPWVVSCTRGPIGFDDFLFTADLVWGHPSQTELVTHLKDCFEKRVDYWDHSHTRAIMDELKSTGLPRE